MKAWRVYRQVVARSHYFIDVWQYAEMHLNIFLTTQDVNKNTFFMTMYLVFRKKKAILKSDKTTKDSGNDDTDQL
jgi:hypothetical protein